MREARHDVLFEPIQIGSKVLRNRFYSTPHASFVVGRRMSDVAFRRMKAEGGFAVVCGGVTSIRQDAWGGLVPRIWDEDERAMLGRMAAEVSGQGAMAGIEFGHGGVSSMGSKFSPSIGPSQLASPDHPQLVPMAMDLDDIRQIQSDWIDAASTAADLGFEIIYSYGSHGTLPAQFLSPFLNRRTDQYGGSIENRARFWLELTDGIRNAVGDRALVAARIAAESFNEQGVSFDDSMAFVRMADDLVDLWDVNLGFGWSPDSSPSRLTDEGSQLEWTGRLREYTAKPIVGVSRLTSPDRMAEIVRSGVWDLIGAARPGIADPFLPKKIEEGRYDDIRECTGTNFCIAVETTGIGLGCVQNATIGEEYRRGWHPERFSQTARGEDAVLIVGGGPAGLETARVLGERGFGFVHIVEARPDVGGHLALLRRLPRLGDWGRVIDYRKSQLAKLDNVAVVTGKRLSADDILDYGASVVVVATGARWLDVADPWHDIDPVRHSSTAIRIIGPDEVMSGVGHPDGTVLVWDAEGGPVGIGIAETLARGGNGVLLATPFDRVSPLLDATFEGGGARRVLRETGVEILVGVELHSVVGDTVSLVDGSGVLHEVRPETVVPVTQRVSEDSLFHELRERQSDLTLAGISDLLRVGDCVAPRHFGLAIADGHRLGRELDSGRPAVPMDPIVERDHHGPTADFTWRDETVLTVSAP